MTPLRIQLRRTRGWKKPDNTIVVSRPSKWGNPYRADKLGNETAVRCYRTELEWYLSGKTLRPLTVMEKGLRELRGHHLACWCKLCPAHRDGKPLGVTCPDCAPCHADVLGEAANR